MSFLNVQKKLTLMKVEKGVFVGKTIKFSNPMARGLNDNARGQLK